MDTSEHAALPSNMQSSSSANAKDVHMTQVHQRGLASVVSPTEQRADPVVLAVTHPSLLPLLSAGIVTSHAANGEPHMLGCTQQRWCSAW